MFRMAQNLIKEYTDEYGFKFAPGKNIFGMFSTSFSFSKGEEEQLLKARSMYTEAIFIRSLNPSDFNANIEVLKEYMKVNAIMRNVINPHLEKAKGSSVVGIFIKATSYIFTDEVNQIMQTEFEREPRIVLLKADKGCKNGEQDTYTIKFSNDETLTFHSLDQKELAKVKKQFDAKMDQLASTNCLRPGGKKS